MNEITEAPMALSIIGAGRVGRTLLAVSSLPGNTLEVELLCRDYASRDLAGRVLLLCVPDREIAGVAKSLRDEANLPHAIGHTSGATTLDPLSGCHSGGGCFSLHPLQTIPDENTSISGCPAAVAGSNEAALAVSASLAESFKMKAFSVDEADRALYHAAASMASNFLITLEETAASVLDGINVENPREVLAPLVRQSLENWVKEGSGALTGPIIRGDSQTVTAHRTALASSRQIGRASCRERV